MAAKLAGRSGAGLGHSRGFLPLSFWADGFRGGTASSPRGGTTAGDRSRNKVFSGESGRSEPARDRCASTKIPSRTQFSSARAPSGSHTYPDIGRTVPVMVRHWIKPA
jgi:hypothetical protein